MKKKTFCNVDQKKLPKKREDKKSFFILNFLSQPATVVCKMEAQSEHVHIKCTFLRILAPIRMLSRCLVTKISASELSRKFIKSALLLVGL